MSKTGAARTPLNKSVNTFHSQEEKNKTREELQKQVEAESAAAIAGKELASLPTAPRYTKKISMAAIEVNKSRQPRVEMDSDYVSELKEALENLTKLPPIRVFSDTGEAPFFLSDGFHRFEANGLLGYREIEAEVFFGTAFDAFRASLSANTEHGKRRTNADKRRAVVLALEDETLGKLNDRQIGELCEVAHTTVFNIRGQLFKLNNSTQKGGSKAGKAKNDKEPKTRKGKDGKNYPTKKDKPKAATEEIFDGNGILIPESLHGKWRDTTATVLDLQMHTHVLLNQWPEKMFGSLTRGIKESLNELLLALNVELNSDQTAIVSKHPIGTSMGE